MKRLTVVLLVGLVACGGEPTAGEDRVTVPTGGEIPLCRELEWFSGPEEQYEDSPVYVGNEMPIDTVNAYAGGMDGFVEAWIDREHNGWVNVGFVDADIEAAQAELDEAFPEDGVVAVTLPYTHDDLEGIRQQVDSALPEEFDASNTHILHGRVEVWVGRLTDESIARVENAVGDRPVCVDGQDPASAPEPGPQPDGGDGWTYLGEADQSLGHSQPVAIVGDTEGLRSLWELIGGPDDPPDVDFDTAIVVGLEIGYSGSCPETRLDDVVVEESAVQIVVSHISEEMACTDDYNPRTYLLAIEREVVPAPPFTVGGANTPALAVQVQNDLRDPGTIPGNLGPAPEPEPTAGIPEFIEVGFPWDAVLDTNCDIAILGPVNGVMWGTDEEFPTEWETFVGEGGLLDVTLVMSEGPQPTLTVTAGNHEVVYEPTDQPAETCP